MDLIGIIHIHLILHVLSELDILVEASPSGPCSWISWRLSLPLYALYDLPGLRVDPSKWIHPLVILCEDITSWSSLGRSPIGRGHLLSGRGMLHVLLVESWSHVQVGVRASNDRLALVAADVRGDLGSLAANVVQIVMDVKVLSLVHYGCSSLCIVILRNLFVDSIG